MHITTFAYRPEGNGLFEQTLRTLLHSLMKKAARDPKNWDLVFPLVPMGYRISVQTSMGHCPFKLMHGRACWMPSACTSCPRS
jgi:hypothetical protein